MGIKTKDKKKTYIETEPEHFIPHLQDYVRRNNLPINTYENMLNAARQYFSGSYYPLERLEASGKNEALDLYKEMKGDVISSIQKEEGYSRSGAEGVYERRKRFLDDPVFIEVPVKKRTMFEKARANNKLVVGLKRGKRVQAYKTTITVYVDRDGGLVSPPKRGRRR